ncbi:MAG TPA: hypothetical protein VF487_06090 [Chitinophagaceae bacterium]
MKTIYTFCLLILSLISAAQNTEKYFYDLKSKTFRIADNSLDEQVTINNFSIWAVNRNLNIVGSNPTLNPDILGSTDSFAMSKSVDASKYSWLLSNGIGQDVLSPASTIRSYVSNFTAGGDHTSATYRSFMINHAGLSESNFLYEFDSLLKNTSLQKSQFAISTSANSSYTFFGIPNIGDHAELIQDSSLILFSSFTNISKAIYTNKDEIQSFKFSENVLMDEQGNSLSLRTTNFSNSITSLYSAAPGNGGVVTERGIYQTNWNGSDNVSYAILKAGTPTEAASFTLNPSANVSNNNQESYFIIRSSDNNSFAVGTISGSNALVGFRNPAGTVLALKADEIETSGVFTTQGLTVLNGDKDQLKKTQDAIAYFVSNNSEGTNIQIINGSTSTNAFTGVTFTQGNVSNRIATYPNNNGLSYLNDAFAFESNSPSGMVFTVNSNLNVEPGRIRFLFDSKAAVTITATSLSVANALLLQGITDEQMLELNPQEGTIVNNTDRKKLLYNDGNEWYEILMKPIKVQNR